MRPPLLIRYLLRATAGDAEAEYVAGDLEEEFALVCEKQGRGAGNRWYRGQVVRSLWPLLRIRVRAGELTETLRHRIAAMLPQEKC